MAQILGQPFGIGKNGYLTISSNTTWTSITGVVVASCSGTVGTTSLSATGSFVAGQIILIHHSRGTTGNTGGWELNQVQSYVAGTITTLLPLANTYTDSGADQSQVQTVPEFNSVTVNSGITLSAGEWAGNTGGVIAFLCSGKTTVYGTVSANGTGFVGGSGVGGSTANQGEGSSGAGTASTSANGTGGGGGAGAGNKGGGGGGGGYAAVGTNGTTNGDGTGGTGGETAGIATLSTVLFGGAGGGASRGPGVGGTPGNGGDSGGIIIILSKTIEITGGITSNGVDGTAGTEEGGGGGGGSGGSILIKAGTVTAGTNLMTATAGSGGAGGPGGNGGAGGAGSVGRIRIESLSLSGTTNPAASTNTGSTNSWSGNVGLIG